MPDDSLLSIQTQVITAPLEEGMDRAAAAVRLSTDEMNSAFEAAGISSDDAANTIAVSMQRAATGTREAAAETVRQNAGGGGSATHVHFNITALDGQDVQRFFDKHSDKLARTIKRKIRAGAARN